MYTLFLICALVGGTVFILQFVLAIVGAGADDLDFGATTFRTTCRTISRAMSPAMRGMRRGTLTATVRPGCLA